MPTETKPVLHNHQRTCYGLIAGSLANRLDKCERCGRSACHRIHQLKKRDPLPSSNIHSTVKEGDRRDNQLGLIPDLHGFQGYTAQAGRKLVWFEASPLVILTAMDKVSVTGKV